MLADALCDYYTYKGVNKKNFDELKAVCSQPSEDYYMGVEKYDQLQDIVDTIVAGACDVSMYP